MDLQVREQSFSTSIVGAQGRTLGSLEMSTSVTTTLMPNGAWQTVKVVSIRLVQQNQKTDTHLSILPLAQHRHKDFISSIQ